MPVSEESCAHADGAGPTCRWHDDVRMTVHDLTADNGRQWDAILKLSNTLESVEQSAIELRHSVDILNRGLENHERTAHRMNGQEKKDDFGDNMRRIFWRIVELALIGGVLWVAAQALHGAKP